MAQPMVYKEIKAKWKDRFKYQRKHGNQCINSSKCLIAIFGEGIDKKIND